jgi:hypothetical protein
MKRMLFLAALIALLLAACAPQQTATQAPPEPTTAPAPTEPPTPAWTAPEGALAAFKVEAAPTLDGVGDDAAWAEAEEIVVPVSGGANFGGAGNTEVHLKAVYSGDTVYFLASYADPTESFFRSPWQMQADGTWLKVKDPNDKGGDNNAVYEDKLAFIWPIGTVTNFQTAGCFAACHAGENSDIKPYGNKYLPEGEKADIWHWKSIRNLNQVDDQYLDSVKLDTSSPEAQAKTLDAGRHGDPNDGGGYVDNYATMPDPADATKTIQDKTQPGFTSPNIDMTTGAPGFILESEKVAIDPAAIPAGSYIPGIIKSEFVGDRGDLSAAWTYADGTWTIEFSRKLTTGSEVDVQFSDLMATYYFGVSAFDNAQVRHAYETGASMLVFEP